ncbi:MAG: HEPN domain-containing protein [Limisphaerales bacterium]
MGDYTATENDLIRAYRLMSHAEFESYFEDRAIQIAANALKSYVRRGRSGRVLAALMTFSPLALQSPPSSLNSNAKFDDPISRVHRVVAQFTTEVRDLNHGIKESNIIAMFYPVGVTKADLDATFLNTLNSYGQNRGVSAHQSVKAQQPIDPVTELKMVEDLIREIQKLDLILQALVD